MDFVQKNSSKQTSSITVRQALQDPKYSRVTWVIVSFTLINVLFSWMS